MTKMVDRLEETGPAARRPTDTDRRVTSMVLHFSAHLTVEELRNVRSALLKVVEAEDGLIPDIGL